MSDERELSLPPHPAGTVQLLRERGHSVTYRRNRNGSFRYSVDGSRELTALEMSYRLDRILKQERKQ